MGLVRRENGVYYVRLQQNKKSVIFSLKTRSTLLAKELYSVYLKSRLENRLQPILIENTPGSNISKFEKQKVIQPNNESIHKIWKDYYRIAELVPLSHVQLNIKSLVKKHLDLYQFKTFASFNQLNLNKLFTYYKSKYQDNSIKKFMNEIRCFLNYAIKLGKYSIDEYRKITWIKVITRAKTTIFTLEDLNLIKEAINDEDFRVYFNTLISLCARPEEICGDTDKKYCGIKVSDFNFNNNTCHYYMNKKKSIRLSSFQRNILNISKE